MKRLIASLVVSLGLVLANIGTAAAATRYWEVRIFDPAASTVNRTLNVEYKVFSTLAEDDDFIVRLFQNNTEVATHTVAHPHGNSGVFSISIPATGTYKYKVSATNTEAGETKETAEKTVQIVDGPAPTVTTVFVNNGTDTGGIQTAAAGGANAADGSGAGEVAGSTANEGQVSAEGSATDENKEDSGDVLGESGTTDNNNRRNIALWIIVAVAVAGAVYYWFLARPRDSA